MHGIAEAPGAGGLVLVSRPNWHRIVQELMTGLCKVQHYDNSQLDRESANHADDAMDYSVRIRISSFPVTISTVDSDSE